MQVSSGSGLGLCLCLCLRVKGLFLYSDGVLLHGECCITQL